MSGLPTFGAEEEFLLVDPRTGEPAPRNTAVAEEAERRGATLQLELSSCQVETNSSVTATSAELGEQLTRLRRAAAEAAEAAGVQLLATGLPPATPHEFPLTDTPRYRRIGAAYGMVAHEQGICGCHVHVQAPDGELPDRRDPGGRRAGHGRRDGAARHPGPGGGDDRARGARRGQRAPAARGVARRVLEGRARRARGRHARPDPRTRSGAGARGVGRAGATGAPGAGRAR